MPITPISLPPCTTVEELRAATEMALKKIVVQINTEKVTKPFDMNNNRIVNVGYPNSLTDGVNVRYLKKAVADINIHRKSSPGGGPDHWWARAIIPGTATAANDVMDNRYRLKIGADEMVVLERCSTTAKSGPSGGAYGADILVSTDTGANFTTIFNATNTATIPDGNTVGEQTDLTITTLANDHELRVDVIAGHGAIGIELVLKGTIVPIGA